MKKTFWFVFVISCVIIGVYPLIYFLIDINSGQLPKKSIETLTNNLWNIAFYGHISLAGLALLIGWAQFSPKLRKINIKLHRTIGKTYVVSVLISGVFGLYIALYATGGVISAVGFFTLSIVWISTTFLGFKAIKNGNIELHKKFMVFSFAACFAAVTLRAWLPILHNLTGDFLSAYRIVAWLCWLPNMAVAYLIVSKKVHKLN